MGLWNAELTCTILALSVSHPPRICVNFLTSLYSLIFYSHSKQTPNAHQPTNPNQTTSLGTSPPLKQPQSAMTISNPVKPAQA